MSPHAFSLLRDSPASFRQTYGDYYLAALCLGADTSTFLSTSSSVDLKAEMRDIQVKAKFLGMQKTVYEDHKQSASVTSAYDITYCGFDTLTESQKTAQAHDRQSYMELQAEATQNVARGMTLGKQIKQAVQRLNLGEDIETAILTDEQCKAVCGSGLVVELVFLPYARLRDYILATTAAHVY